MQVTDCIYSNDFDLLDQIEQTTQFKPKQIVYDGCIHRYGSNQCCWYVAYPSGVITCGNWKTGMKLSFHNRSDKQLNQSDNYFIKLAKKQEYRDKLVLEKRLKQTQLWASAKQASEYHPYLLKKKVKAYGLRQRGQTLLIPIRNIQGKLRALQHIYPDGTKRIFASYKRGFHHMGKPSSDGKVYIGEGYATMATIYECTGACSVVAFSTSNLTHVGLVIRKYYPRSELIFCADNDHKTEKKIGINTGVMYARKAAKACLAKVLIPRFSFGEKGSDFNDVLNSGRVEL